MSKLTPMFEQYLQIKEDYPDALLFYRMGDFYELFFEDAETAARELQITLTARNPNAETKIPMCGVPHHSADGYLTQLLAKGHKVAICEQIEDPKQAKGLVQRAVTRVLTPGTVVEDASLTAKEHNFLAALFWDAEKASGGLAWIDFSTGEWTGLSSRKEELLWQWMLKIGPRELILPREGSIPALYSDIPAQITSVPARAHFDFSGARRKILEVQEVAGLEILDLEDKPELVRALGALLTYLKQTQKQTLGHLGPFRPLYLAKYLILDEVTEKNLEIFRRLDGKSGKGTLWHVLDNTMTPMGGRYLEARLRQPWRDLSTIRRNQSAVAFLHDADDLRSEVRSRLDHVYDLERLSTRIFLGRATPRDFVALRASLERLPELRGLLADLGSNLPEEIARIVDGWDDLSDLHELLRRSLVDSPPPLVTDGGLFRPGYRPELDELLDLTEHGEARLEELLARERENGELPKLKLGYNRVFGYFFELSKSHKGHVPEHFVRRQTLANSERYITPELKELEDRLLSAAEKRKSLEYNLFLELRDILAGARSRFMAMAQRVAGIDFWQSLAETARHAEWRRPDLHTGTAVNIRAGRHPVVEAVQGASNFIPNDLRMDDEARLLLITGPNMAGKSTILRQTALIMILAQIGSFVPAAEASIGLVDRIFSRVGASDNLAQGQSTFMVEMMETARILRQATRRSFVILDEIGRGTSTYDGLALARAVAEELSRRCGGGIRTLFATHYHELTALEAELDGVRNFNIAIRQWRGDMIFLRRLVPGPSDRSYGIEVAKLAGVPQGVVQRAREILDELERRRDLTGGTKSSAPTVSQSLLPGMSPPKNQEPPPDHPLLKELRRVKVDQLTPLEALTLLSHWKTLLENDE